MSNAAPLSWNLIPGGTAYFVNSVAISNDATKIVTGTFYHSYSTSTDAPQPSVPAPRPARSSSKEDATDTSNYGTFGTYCYDGSGALLWQNQWQGFEGTYWVALTGTGQFAASCGWYSGTPNYQGFVNLFDATQSTGTPIWQFLTSTGRVNFVGFANDNSVLVAGGQSVWIFMPNGSNYSSTPLVVDLPAIGGKADAVQAMVAMPNQNGTNVVIVGTYLGQVYGITVNNNQASIVATWTANGGVHSLATCVNGTQFVSGQAGGFAVFNTANFIAINQGPKWSAQLPGTNAVYGVSMSSDAMFVSAVGNIGTTGVVAVYQNYVVSGKQIWSYDTAHNPNSTVIDAQGKFVAVADGHPDGFPGAFYLLDLRSGELLWQYTTGNMSWPCAISANASTMVAGSDDGNLYCFKPLAS